MKNYILILAVLAVVYFFMAKKKGWPLPGFLKQKPSASPAQSETPTQTQPSTQTPPFVAVVPESNGGAFIIRE